MTGIMTCCEIGCNEFPACEATMKNDLSQLESIEKDDLETARNSEPIRSDSEW